MRSYIEIIYIDNEDLARKTDMEHVSATNAETWAEFNSLRKYEVGSKPARFLLDYHNSKGDLADTICIDVGGFIAITGVQPKSDARYRAIDRWYWQNASRENTHTVQRMRMEKSSEKVA
jgi:hypothetical protein